MKMNVDQISLDLKEKNERNSGDISKTRQRWTWLKLINT
jgi:hypothetical protein